MDCKAPLGFKKILSDGSHQEVFVPQNRKYISAYLFCDIMIADFDGINSDVGREMEEKMDMVLLVDY